ncbi:MAG TPA: TIGR04086 family membrane protein [Sedimentibacter sp.]|nr:TIGR04086 family membrane protein [Sedimentibacter sp.]HOK48763.1 TIGR04086 family membrane protein [Sedimentibacter sp.]HOW23422.1 TIGR04086 family membrane protein [Sedimentibacter sp.]HRC81684.1 TIGR04086 family membrane protein [Sedimentibacter sp.]
MKLRNLFKYSIFLFILSLIVFFILTVFIYYFSKNPALEIAYSFIVPICIFAVSILYSRSVHEKGLLRGIEIWIVYFVMVLLIKVLSGYPAEIRVLYNGVILLMSLLGGIIGVNMKNKSIKS